MQSSHCLQKMTHRTLSHCRLAGAERHGAVARAFDLSFPPVTINGVSLPGWSLPTLSPARPHRRSHACARHAPGTQFALVQCTLIMALVPDQRLLRMPIYTAVFQRSDRRQLVWQVWAMHGSKVRSKCLAK